MNRDLDRWTEQHHANVELEESPAEAIIFWACVGFWMWFGAYHLTIWALT
jgi:hypothetical protein